MFKIVVNYSWHQKSIKSKFSSIFYDNKNQLNNNEELHHCGQQVPPKLISAAFHLQEDGRLKKKQRHHEVYVVSGCSNHRTEDYNAFNNGNIIDRTMALDAVELESFKIPANHSNLILNLKDHAFCTRQTSRRNPHVNSLVGQEPRPLINARVSDATMSIKPIVPTTEFNTNLCYNIRFLSQ